MYELQDSAYWGRGCPNGPVIGAVSIHYAPHEGEGDIWFLVRIPSASLAS